MSTELFEDSRLVFFFVSQHLLADKKHTKNVPFWSSKKVMIVCVPVWKGHHLSSSHSLILTAKY